MVDCATQHLWRGCLALRPIALVGLRLPSSCLRSWLTHGLRTVGSNRRESKISAETSGTAERARNGCDTCNMC